MRPAFVTSTFSVSVSKSQATAPAGTQFSTSIVSSMWVVPSLVATWNAPSKSFSLERSMSSVAAPSAGTVE